MEITPRCLLHKRTLEDTILFTDSIQLKALLDYGHSKGFTWNDGVSYLDDTRKEEFSKGAINLTRGMYYGEKVIKKIGGEFRSLTAPEELLIGLRVLRKRKR
jgi:hypothetical protein